MRLRFIWVGKTRDAHLRALIDEYLKRLTRFVRYEVTELRESAARNKRAGGGGGGGIEEEGKRIISALRSDALTILLDVAGREWSSAQLAREVERWRIESIKEIAFVIGGPDGVSTAVTQRADASWSLSRLTLTHELARVVLVEQIYRAYTIIHGLPYQK